MEFRTDLPHQARGRLRNGAIAWATEASEVRANAPQWGLVKVFPVEKHAAARSAARSAGNGKLAAFKPAGTFQASTRKTERGIELWVRYVGLPAKEKTGA